MLIKVMYTCPRCDYETSKKSSIRNHFKRKTICKPLNSDTSIEECIKLLESDQLKFNLECSHCNKKFNSRKRLEAHYEMCVKPEKTGEQMITVNNNYNTTTYNIINIKSFKNTNYLALKDEIINCLEDQDPQLKVPVFERLVDKIHFNKDYPENHNIYKPNVRDDRILTFNGEDFIVDKFAIDKILDNLEDILKQCGKDYLEKLKHHLQLKQKDRDYSEATKDDIAVSLYNGRNIVKNTHKSVNHA